MRASGEKYTARGFPNGTDKVLKHLPRPVLMVRAFRTRVRLLHEGEIWSLKG